MGSKRNRIFLSGVRTCRNRRDCHCQLWQHRLSPDRIQLRSPLNTESLDHSELRRRAQYEEVLCKNLPFVPQGRACLDAFDVNRLTKKPRGRPPKDPHPVDCSLLEYFPTHVHQTITPILDRAANKELERRLLLRLSS